MNDKIAKWILAGKLPKDLSKVERKAYGLFTYRNGKFLDDTDAVVLLPVLMERGYSIDLFNDDMKWLFIATQDKSSTDGYVEGVTISEAITSVILQLIDKKQN